MANTGRTSGSYGNGMVVNVASAEISASSSGHHESGTPCPSCCIDRTYNPGGHGSPDRSAGASNTSRILVQAFQILSGSEGLTLGLTHPYAKQGVKHI